MPGTKAENLHRSVLLDETLQMLDPNRGGVFVDATLGMAGHSEAILRANPDNILIGLDQDLAAIGLATERLQSFGKRSHIVHSSFSQLKPVLDELGYERVDAILADLGVSSLQLDDAKRGFSFRFDAPLDMRMDASADIPTAADLLETLSEEEIANIIYRFGEERFSRRIARRVIERRKAGNPVRTTGELTELVERSVRRSPKDKIHPATRTFQALRIAVNRETEVLEQFVVDAVESLKTEGRLAIITFHSLEDRIVKQAFQRLSGKCQCPPKIPQCICGARREVEILTRKPIAPGEEETAANPRSRSAKLRAVRKI
ncbi:MAG TPA: 16S rRNA (cytosine(1402)-N(4))-methyltransferase RsmH [Pyrinomonadaceae bacterium]|nr:16S rRNA (cytosine(1402)-N(4))-methyltransferase RsmH [Pyrinomonadaceae bacterium]